MHNPVKSPLDAIEKYTAICIGIFVFMIVILNAVQLNSLLSAFFQSAPSATVNVQPSRSSITTTTTTQDVPPVMNTVVAPSESTIQQTVPPDTGIVIGDVISSEADKPLTLFVVGDVFIGRYIETILSTKGYDAIFGRVKELFGGNDIVLGNLEFPLVSNVPQTKNGSLIFAVPPERTQLLKDAGFNIVTTANNHSLDRGIDGFNETLRTLDAYGIEHAGHPARVSEDDALLVSHRGQSIAIIAINATKPVITKDVTDLIRKLKANAKVFIIVSVHGGNEYQTRSSKHQRLLAHELIDAGADVFIGHHPHVVQELELYRDRLIAYSLGNFIFDQYFSAETQRSLGLQITLSADTVTYRLVPIDLTHSQPRPMEPTAANAFIDTIAKRSTIELQNQIRSGLISLERTINHE